jgi:ubiquitin-conjugating enzyme E2 O
MRIYVRFGDSHHQSTVHWVSGAAPDSTLNILANSSHLDPSSSEAGTELSLRKHEPDFSSNISMIKEVRGFEIVDYNSVNQFDVVQDYSDHHYAKTSPGNVCYFFS